MKKFIINLGKVITILSIIPLILFIIAILAILFPEKEKNPYEYIKNDLHIDLSQCINEYNIYEYFRDGEAFMSFDCTNSNPDMSIQVKKWQELPLTENIDKMIYGTLELDKKYNFDKIENGYYYFIDRYTERYMDGNDIYSDELLFENRPKRFTVAIYDTDNKHFYYYKIDT